MLHEAVEGGEAIEVQVEAEEEEVGVLYRRPRMELARFQISWRFIVGPCKHNVSITELAPGPREKRD